MVGLSERKKHIPEFLLLRPATGMAEMMKQFMGWAADVEAGLPPVIPY
jgi:hypothetical protein